MTQHIALITGGSRGLGRNAALHLARKGVDIILTFNTNGAEAANAVTEIEALGRRAVALQLDTATTVGLPDFVAAVAGALKAHWQHDTFDFLVNNAGIGIYASFVDTTEADFDLLMNIHVKSVFFLTQRLLPLLHDGGRIVNISTGLSRFTLPGYAAYASMKGAVEVLSRYMAKELGSRGITVNVVAPGPIETDFGGGVVRDNADLNGYLASQAALGRVGLPDDVGGAICSLLTGDNGWITAQRIEVSGGQNL
jgi:NAD(P)-dependent dehydrogenase (short-subunit alcohol dehydrogenase family)